MPKVPNLAGMAKKKREPREPKPLTRSVGVRMPETKWANLHAHCHRSGESRNRLMEDAITEKMKDKGVDL